MRFALTLGLCFSLAVAGGFYGLSIYSKKTGPLESNKIVFIAPGTGVRAMANQLTEDGVIDNPYVFLGVVKFKDLSQKLKAGEYALPAHISLVTLIDKIARGDVMVRKITIPEGLSSYDVVSIFNAAGAMQGQITTPAEGSVLPNTYAYIRNDERPKILAQMQAAMTKTLDDLWPRRAPDLPFTTKEQALVLASIVEKETGIGLERARIAGVFANRLRIGMRLQSDPTVIYAITKGQSKIERVLYGHLETDSPYNTYKYAGLPPAPICNPGAAAIEATLNPEKHDFLYFVADGRGGHVFARTLAEHNANVAKWRVVQRQQP
jgi:UPF0755 protein